MSALHKIFRRLSGMDSAASRPSRDEQLRLATAVLLVEMMRADFSEHQSEAQAVENLLARHFKLDAAESEALAEDARDEADRAVSLHDYTRLLHAELAAEEKSRLIEMLWEVALADESLDKYEDYLVRKIAELLYVPHAELIRLRHAVEARRSGSGQRAAKKNAPGN